MITQKYNVSQPQITTIMTWIRDGEIAIPEIQRPFVWDATKVRNFLDSLYRGYPVGYLITWKNPDVKLKDGTKSSGKKILIDGQQRVTALMAALFGQEVVNKDYKKVRIKISFHPVRNEFEVYNSAIAKDISWIPDISNIFDPANNIFVVAKTYCKNNPEVDENVVMENLVKLHSVVNNQIGMIELAPDLDIDTVTEIFIRVNSEGVPLSQADFAMSKIAVNEKYGGHILRKAIDYFCHLAVAPEFFDTVKQDAEFAASEYFNQIKWLKNENDDIYDPDYTDMIRVAFTSEFKRGRMEDLVALLSGRNFTTHQYEEEIVEDSFQRLKRGVQNFINENHFKKFVLIIRSAGFISSNMISSQNALNFAYILYLYLLKQNVKQHEIEQYVRRWFVMSLLTGRYTSSPETAFDTDIRQINEKGLDSYARAIIEGALADTFWDIVLPQQLETSSTISPAFNVFLAAQVKLGDRGFLSRDITVHDLLAVKSDLHHIFPRDFLKKKGFARSRYNQVANYVVTQSEINIAIGNKEPRVYIGQVLEQCSGGPKLYGNIDNLETLKENFRMNCIPDGIERMTVDDYDYFLAERRKLMARKIKEYYALL